jgi:hypothetical protein
MPRIALFALASLLAASHPTLAQTPGAAPLGPRPPSHAPECGGKAALYTAGKVQVWVTRRGTVQEDNPLRPLSPATLTVLQVVVNGRSATAFGPDFEHMRQGGTPARLAEAAGHPIAWDGGPQAFPAAFRVVSEDGRVLLGPLAFQSCGDAPAAAAEVPVRASRPQARPAGEGRRNEREGGDRPGLPKGAIPSDGKGGLSLPQP